MIRSGKWEKQHEESSKYTKISLPPVQQRFLPTPVYSWPPVSSYHTHHTWYDDIFPYILCVFEILDTMTHSMALHLSVFCYLDTLIWLENHFKVNTKRSRNSRKKDDQSLCLPILGGSERRELLYNTQLGHRKPHSIKELVQTHPVHPYPKKDTKGKRNSTETLLFSPKSRE